ncbi:MAG: DUF4278 domain-containing protein [Merismopedia sp. SIO2A8]|nr:DUF4278 domain-containing protein [Symploca sp. SIO2B6]NET52284.1 DUF4278 domain-containing protein [Merismopedia sp. SIO2A8]
MKLSYRGVSYEPRNSQQQLELLKILPEPSRRIELKYRGVSYNRHHLYLARKLEFDKTPELQPVML